MVLSPLILCQNNKNSEQNERTRHSKYMTTAEGPEKTIGNLNQDTSLQDSMLGLPDGRKEG
jgi:hypothetical protein